MKNNIEVLSDLKRQFNEKLKIDNVTTRHEEYYDTVAEHGKTDKLNDIIDEFQSKLKHKSNISSLFSRVDLKIGIICDEFLFHSLKDSADFHYVPYNENLSVNKEFDIFLVVTSWRGLDNSWDYIANPNGIKRKKLIELINGYNNIDIPTVFYSKEDPASYHEYISLAKECKYIFTSAKEMIDKYKKDTKNENVDFLEFGINVSYHNPIGKDLKDNLLSNQITFAGSWMKRFPERNATALRLFEGVIKTNYDLSIIDRQYVRKMERYHYPSYLLNFVSATISHNRLMNLHKATQWGINLNSVQDSMTMFANRIYELQGMGNIILSNYSKGVHYNFPNVKMVYSKDDVQEILNYMPFEDKKRYIADGIRNVMFNHTAFHRIAKLVKTIGYEYDISIPSILIIGHGENSKNSYERQIYTNLAYIDKTDLEKRESVLREHDFIIEFKETYHYEEYYIQNLLSAFVYTDADVVQMGEDYYDYLMTEDDNNDHKLYKSDLYQSEQNKSSKVLFNIPKTEFSVANMNSKVKELSEPLLTVIITVDNNNIGMVGYKSLYSLKMLEQHTAINILLFSREKLNESNRKIISRLKRENSNIRLVTTSDVDYQEKDNDILKKVDTELVSFLNAENELLIKEYKQLIDELHNNPKLDLMIGHSTNYKSEFKPYSNFLDMIINKDFNKTNHLEKIIFRTEYLKKQSISVMGDELYTNSFIFKLNFDSQNHKILRGVVHKNNTAYKNISSAEEAKAALKISLVEERDKMLFLLENNLMDDYTNEVLPKLFINDYLYTFRYLNQDDKSMGLEILKDIIDLYIENYRYDDVEFNQVLGLLFNYSE